MFSLKEFLLKSLKCLTPPTSGFVCPTCKARFADDTQKTASGKCCFCTQWEATTSTSSVVPFAGIRSLALTLEAPPVDLNDVPNPLVFRGDDYLGRAISITIPWTPVTGELQPMTVTRDAGCLFNKVLVGLGEDGVPDNTTKQFTIPVGTFTIQTAQMSNRGLSNIQDVLDAGQITVGL